MSSNASMKDVDSTSPSAEPLYQFRLLSALRSGEPALIQPFLDDFGREKRRRSVDAQSQVESNVLDVAAAALHLAIRVASCETIQLLLGHRSISPNAVHPTGTGTTPLHLAASLGRAQVVEVLLEQEGIDDTQRDVKGHTCKDVAKGKETLKVIQDSQSLLIASYRSLLHTYVASPPNSPAPPALITLLSSPRIKLANLSYLDDASGSTLLHEAARRRDIKLVELAIKAGADVFVRDIRGKGVGHGMPKDDRIRVLLRQYTNQNTALMEESVPLSGPPELKGYLNKYTNVARGYNTRWFVLKDGVLSYYRHQQDENIASRGSIAMKNALLKSSSSSDKLRFEIHSVPVYSHHAAQRWFMKANHPIEISRWMSALQKSIEWAKRVEGGEGRGGDAASMHSRRPSGESARSMSSISVSGAAGGNGGVPGAPGAPKDKATSIRGALKRRLTSHSTTTVASLGEKDKVPPLPLAPGMAARPSEDAYSLDQGNESDFAGAGPAHGGRFPSTSAEEDNADDAEAEQSGSGEDSAAGDSARPPHESEFMLHGGATVAQMHLTSQLLDQLALPPNASPRAVELKGALKEALAQVGGMLDEYVKMTSERDEWWRVRLEKEKERQKVWEQSLQVVVQEGADLERELKERFGSRRRSRMSTYGGAYDGAGGSTLRQKTISSPASSPATTTVGLGVRSRQATVIPATLEFAQAVDAASPVTEMTPTAERLQLLSLTTPTASNTPPVFHPTTIVNSPPADDDDMDDDDDDEFFDAIEANTLPNLTVNNALIPGSPKPRVLNAIKKENLYEGYAHMRDRLPIDNDKRPSTSLWSVLKHNIGKDLTKITFPVSFNEPTSMLQRMAEDMEFSECLDAAVAETEPHRRIAFVAAFAMSNYSSTIGRIAKPFNPMLGETFEYVQLDKGYRYMSEQVSHHPPMSACWAEAPSWHYYGEVDAKNKFMGKSFEIRPTGVAHADLLLPEELGGSDYPHVTGVDGNTKAVEHYSWKKVTTNVSGFILGSPTIDHYGDMIVTNHRTGDQCTLTFKPRGWRGADAFEIQGKIMDADGRVTYEIAGRWNSQLVARAVGRGNGYLLPDVNVSGSTTTTSSSDPEYILLWRNTEKPVAPFNLTPFAITLNDCPETLKPYLPPTDCRLRPDQRAFEIGEYDKANELKGAQEELQRQTRKLREEGKLPPHVPRWFEATTEADTGERVWVPSRVDEMLEYWTERERVFESGGAEWKNVDKIFVSQN